MFLLRLLIAFYCFSSYSSLSAGNVKTANIKKFPVKYSKTSVTYSFSGGRFGDNLVAYLHAKWISYKYNIPLLYVPFPYSDHLVLDDVERASNSCENHHFSTHRTFKTEQELQSYAHNPITWCVPYFPESVCEFDLYDLDDLPYFAVNWDDPNFKTLIKSLISPKGPLYQQNLPQDRITVAVHVRRGSGGDIPEFQFHFPLKLPPDSYFIEQIKTIHDIFDRQPLYVFIFTDNQKPLELVEKYRNALNRPNIEIACRGPEVDTQIGILDDFFAMTKFDCLIRPESSFSIVASKLTDYKVMIKPAHHRIERGEVIIDQVEIQRK